MVDNTTRRASSLKMAALVPRSDGQFSEYLSTGSIIGEVALLTGLPRSATITCDTECKVQSGYIVLYIFRSSVRASLNIVKSLNFLVWKNKAFNISF